MYMERERVWKWAEGTHHVKHLLNARNCARAQRLLYLILTIAL
jgi:hypothetical protein